MRIRDFEVVKRLEDRNDIILPKRSTKCAAGYDFFAQEDIVIPSSIIPNFLNISRNIITREQSLEIGRITPVLVRTGIKAYMPDNEVLMLANRSSNPKKLGLILANSVGIIDSDYYENEDNDGEIAFAFYNLFPIAVKIAKGEKIGQGIFMNFNKTDSDVADDVRSGGFGSTGA
jgi:dUTP pyrophosphatase